MVLLHVGQVRGGLGIAVGPIFQRIVDVLALGLDLFFHERIHDDGGGAGIFEAGEVLQLLRQR